MSRIIPRKIHFCWLSGEPFPGHIKQCMQTWDRVLSGYEKVVWDMNRIRDIRISFVREAIEVKKYAFAADYIRLYALYEQGGIFLDTDVYVLKPFDDFLSHDFFSSIEVDHEAYIRTRLSSQLHSDGRPIDPERMLQGIQIQAAVMGSVKGHPFVSDAMQYYEDRHFIRHDGTYDQTFLAPNIYAKTAEKYGFVYHDSLQELREGMVIYPAETFASHGHLVTDKAFCVHLCAGGWREGKRATLLHRILDIAKNNACLRKLSGNRPILVNSIPYRLRQGGKVSCRVLSLYRQYFMHLAIGPQPAGKHVFHMETLDIPDEKYICQIMQGDRLIREVILIKNILET